MIEHFFEQEKPCFAFVIIIEMLLVKVNRELKFMPRSRASKTLGRIVLPSSNLKFDSEESTFLLVISNHFDFSVEICNCQLFDHSVILAIVKLNVLPSSSCVAGQ